MLFYFPTPYPDELLYSVFSRFHFWAGKTHLSQTLLELFGNKRVRPSYDLPSRLQFLADQIPEGSGLNVKTLIDKHSMLSLYRPFMTVERYQKVLDLMLMRNVEVSAAVLTGRSTSHFPDLDCLRYCPECVEDDKALPDGPYWHRAHQIAGINVCHKHSVGLINSSVRISTGRDSYTLKTLATELESSGIHEHSEEFYHHYEPQLARIAHTLLKENFDPPNFHLADKYRDVLISLGLISPAGGLRRKKLIQLFMDFYGDKYIHSVNSNFAKENASNWIVQHLDNKASRSHPLGHILLVCFLNIDVFRLINEPVVTIGKSPFGSGPWPCLNPVADHYLQDVVENIKTRITKQGKGITGTFTCSCGCSYIRLGPDRCEEDRYKKYKFKEMGTLMDAYIVKSYQQGRTPYQIGKELSISDQSVKKRISDLNKSPSVIDEVDRENFHKKKLKYRRRYKSLINKHPGKGTNGIARMKNSGASWLHKHDRQWFESVNKTIPDKKNKRRSVDWKKRDREFSKIVKSIAKNIKNEGGRPRRVTKRAIINQFDLPSVVKKNLNRMPLTEKEIKDSVESLAEIQVRKIIWAKKELIKEGVSTCRWRTLNKAGLVQYIKLTPEAQKMV